MFAISSLQGHSGNLSLLLKNRGQSTASAHIQMDQGTRMHETLFASTEGRMLGVDLALTGLMLLAFGIGWHLYPDRILPYAIMMGLNLIIGREAGMSFGYASGFGHAQVVPSTS